MQSIFKLTIVFLSLSLQAQFSSTLINDYNSPTYFNTKEKALCYTSSEIYDANSLIRDNQFGLLLFYKQYPFHFKYKHYGYTYYKDRSLSLSSNQALSNLFRIGLNCNLHHLSIANHPQHKALSIDIGISYNNKKSSLELFIENPLNSQFIDDEIDSRLILKGTKYWSHHFHSTIQIDESLYYGTNFKHRLYYQYNDNFKMGIIQSFIPHELGFWIHFTKNRYTVFTQVKKMSWTNSLKLAITYTLIND